MKQKLIFSLLVFAIVNLYGQTYFDIDFVGTGGVNPQTIVVSNLTKNTIVNILGRDLLRLKIINTSVSQVEYENKQLTIFPNPMDHSCQFEFINAQQGSVNIQLLSIEGKLIYNYNRELPQGKQVFLASGISAGVYVLSVKTGNNHITSRFVAKGQEGANLNIVHTSEIPSQQHVKSKSKSAVVEMNYSLGDKLRFIGTAVGYANDTIVASPTESQTFTFNYASESIKYVAPNKIGSGTGDTESNAADFMSENFWKQINNELRTKSIEVKLLAGNYSRASSNKGFILKSIGNAENTLTISGNSNVIFDRGESSLAIGNVFDIQNCQNIILRDIHFTGNGKISYVLLIRSIKDLPASKNITVENCTWKDMRGVVYGATGCHSEGTSDITYKNCTFERIGIDGHSHMMYHAHSASRINIDNCHFEDCTGDYVRFRDKVDFVVVKNCIFIHNDKFDTRQSPFLGVPLFNSRGNVGDEYFATNYAFHDNKFISKPGVKTAIAIYFGHWGFSPPEYIYLLTAQEAAILLNGSYEEKSYLLKKNFGLYVEKIRISNNSFSGNITYNMVLRSYASYGAVSRGWEGNISILDVVNKSKEPFEWEK